MIDIVNLFDTCLSVVICAIDNDDYVTTILKQEIKNQITDLQIE
jgi:hypothetical protein